jgi:eukaryotic-like serine/threonine-protein kinase
MALKPGSRLGHYRVVSPLGAGGMGAVSLAIDERLGRQVALKVPHDAHTDPAAEQRLRREAELAARLTHPNICTIHEVGESGGLPFIAMEHVEGTSLAELVPRGGLPVELILRYGVQLAAAVAHAHAHGVIHRDLKSRNVMVSASGDVKVLDFGIAGLTPTGELEATTRSGKALTGEIAGTLAYLAPEVLRGGAPTTASDIWSLGVVLYEMAAGALPFAGASGFDLTAAILREEPQPLRADLPDTLRRLILRCLAKNPAHRYQHAAEVHAVLEAMADRGLPGSAWSDATHPADAPRRLRRYRWLTFGVVVLAAVAAVLATWSVRQTDAFRLGENRLVDALPGSPRAATFSPDGRTIAFVNDDDRGVAQIFVTDLDRPNPVPITSGDRPAGRPRWSPAGDQIFFNHRGGIWAVAPLGGAPRQIVESGRNASVSTDGRRLAWEGLCASGGDCGIWIGDADGGNRRRLLEKERPLEARPALSPDGRTIVLFLSTGGLRGDLWLLDTGGDAEPRQLTSDGASAQAPAWMPDGSIVVSSRRSGSMTLWRIGLDTGEAEPLTTGSGEDVDVTVAADGRTLVYTNRRLEWGLRLLDLETGEETEVRASRYTLLIPMFSPDGTKLAYFSETPDGEHIFTIRTDGSEHRQLTFTPGERNVFPTWSADGQRLFYLREAPSRSVRSIPSNGGPSTEIASDLELRWGFVSPDATLLAMAEPGRTVMRRLEDGRETVIPAGFRYWVDDRTILGVRPAGRNGGMVVSCDIVASQCTDLVAGYAPVLSGDGRSIFFLRSDFPTRQLWKADRDGSNPRRVGTVGPFQLVETHFDLSRDGRVAFTQYRPGRPELWRARIE